MCRKCTVPTEDRHCSSQSKAGTVTGKARSSQNDSEYNSIKCSIQRSALDDPQCKIHFSGRISTGVGVVKSSK